MACNSRGKTCSYKVIIIIIIIIIININIIIFLNSPHPKTDNQKCGAG